MPAESSAAPDLTADALRAANINPSTYLATDYLNHVNEVVMLLDLVPDMPDLLEEALAWRPKSYPAHFAESGFAGRDLAIAAYAAAPSEIRRRFESVVALIDIAVLDTLRELQAAPAEGVRRIVEEGLPTVRTLIDQASAIVNGTDTASAELSEPGATQLHIDAVLAGA